MIPGVTASRRRGGGGGGDPYWADVVSLLHFDGSNGSTTFTDQKTRTWTANGNAQLSTAQQKWGASSLLLDGTGDSITTPNAAGLSLSGVDATIEAWVRPAASKAAMTWISKRPASGASEFQVTIDSGKLTALAWGAGGVAVVNIAGTTTLSLNTWYHVALSVNGSAWRLFLDGVLEASGTASGAITGNSEVIYLGRDRTNGARDFNGYIDDFRWTAGVGRYTSNFTPPAAPFPNS